MDKNSYWFMFISELFTFSLFLFDHVPIPLNDINGSMRVVKWFMVIFYFLSIKMYLWEFGACIYALGRTRSFSIYIILVYAKGLHLRSGPLCHDVLHSVCHIKIKLHLMYSEISKRKSLLVILILPHLIS